MNGRQTGISAEQQIELLKQQLAQAQKLTALGELASTTTHPRMAQPCFVPKF